jgi:predicted HTH transcriptional regulator
MKFKKVKTMPTTKEKILQILKKKPYRPYQLTKVLKLTRSTVSEHLQDLLKQKKVKWTGTWKVRTYHLAGKKLPKGQEAVVNGKKKRSHVQIRKPKKHFPW